MVKIHHINCGTLQRDPDSLKVLCHCLLLEDIKGLALVDTGIGVHDILFPLERIGQEIIEQAGFNFNLNDTAISALHQLGFTEDEVKHCLVSHLDPDHIGGLADFPGAAVHVSAIEMNSFLEDNPRYCPEQLKHKPFLKLYHDFDEYWFGFAAKRAELDFESEIYLVALPGHTLGHCGIAIQQEDRWLLYAGDAYYLRDELFTENHPVDELAALMAMDNDLRIESLKKLRVIAQNFGEKIELFGFHDPSELKNE
ncbi:glyoxylase-like metal-dependent hydrolase (beta-lactamase superfamily II) [Pedobacter cryoconitis]|uniref:Glyoxylase-like metal-dependent hydrolase (Beta-lactamase superfamily II) n=1 Tax=Pedobacter cryoconitis TaxID=188932 RepID=A0A7W9DWU0_9SPHI|nr:MBL fold metallo-hydrolase [Pedobacter cryoconitis]MBB5634417.1 glyoxylase-like metal-dependent hydrolase (beta-lactamase superfamily II) [Pedobacter cryoconitis]MBB6272458.1 glyoxylase-like metal-dependent hydrolase (beta-lactamase superfamily II) [Pedobacter cryoconitis]